MERVAEVPMDSLMGEMYEVRQRTIKTTVICSLAAILIGLIISLSISHPLKTIMDLMKEGEKGNLTIESEIKGGNEIAQL